jgi:hypothetical protein
MDGVLNASFGVCEQCRAFHWTDEPCSEGIAPEFIHDLRERYRSMHCSFRDFFVCWCGNVAAPHTAQCARHGFPPKR